MGERKITRPTLINVRSGARYTTLIGRPSKWGNPFVIGRDGARGEVIEKYRSWVKRQPVLMAALHELTGETLGCYCKPLACHGDVLIGLWDVKIGKAR